MQSKGNFYYKKEKAQISMDLSLTLPFRLVNSKIWISVIWEDFFTLLTSNPVAVVLLHGKLSS